jgi:hypothetical protein
LTGGRDVLIWELGPNKDLLRVIEKARPSKGLGRVALSESLVQFFASSSPLIAIIAVVAIALAVAGIFVHETAWAWASGGAVSILAACLAIYGIAFSYAHERRG